MRNKIEKILSENSIEFRRGLSGGGNQLRQPYFKNNFDINFDEFDNVEHVHNFSWYIGNYFGITKDKIDILLNLINNV